MIVRVTPLYPGAQGGFMGLPMQIKQLEFEAEDIEDAKYQWFKTYGGGLATTILSVKEIHE